MREELDPDLAAPAARSWWNHHAADYRSEHGDFLADALVWGPEGWTESELGLLGQVSGQHILDIGAGQGQTSAWLRDQGAHVVSLDISEQMLSFGNGERVCADVQSLPFSDARFDLAISAYGAFPFIGDLQTAFRELHRTVRERLVISTTHPIRWAFRDDPNALEAEHSYFDRRAYVERDASGQVSYSEHHRTIADWINTSIQCGFTVTQLIEPEWKAANTQTWDGWSAKRGRIIPGTMILDLHRNP